MWYDERQRRIFFFYCDLARPVIVYLLLIKRVTKACQSSLEDSIVRLCVCVCVPTLFASYFCVAIFIFIFGRMNESVVGVIFPTWPSIVFLFIFFNT